MKNLNYDFDFGFTEEDSIEGLEAAKSIAEEASTEFEKVYKSLAAVTKHLYTLLDNLNKNPDAEYIKWPNRAAKIREFKDTIEQLEYVAIIVENL